MAAGYRKQNLAATVTLVATYPPPSRKRCSSYVEPVVLFGVGPQSENEEVELVRRRLIPIMTRSKVAKHGITQQFVPRGAHVQAWFCSYFVHVILCVKQREGRVKPVIQLISNWNGHLFFCTTSLHQLY